MRCALEACSLQLEALITKVVTVIKMRRTICLSAFILFSAGNVFSQKSPNAEAFTVLRKAQPQGPSITPLLKKQTEEAWKQDDLRSETLKNIKSEKELVALQRETKLKLLNMIGGLPAEKTPLHPQIVGSIQKNGFRIEKLIFES